MNAMWNGEKEGAVCVTLRWVSTIKNQGRKVTLCGQYLWRDSARQVPVTVRAVR